MEEIEIVKKKFENFKKFVKDTVNDEKNEFINLLYKTPFEHFIKTIKEKGNTHTKEKVLLEIFEQAKLNKSDYKEEDINKLCRYLEYFLKISQFIA